MTNSDPGLRRPYAEKAWNSIFRLESPARASWPTLSSGSKRSRELRFVTPLIVGVGISFQVGLWRNSTKAQEEFITGISCRIRAALQTGLRDHVHCWYFGDVPRIQPSVSKLDAQTGSQYPGLIDVMRSHVPDSYRVVGAFQWRCCDARFVRIALTDGRKGISLVLSGLGTTSPLNNDAEMTATILADGVTPFYSDLRDRFQIAVVETCIFFVYLVSEVSQNLTITTAVVPARSTSTLLKQKES